ncbi:MAG: hypothetical protein AAFO79_05520 [Pseudomonadota bacterium]
MVAALFGTAALTPSAFAAPVSQAAMALPVAASPLRRALLGLPQALPTRKPRLARFRSDDVTSLPVLKRRWLSRTPDVVDPLISTPRDLVLNDKLDLAVDGVSATIEGRGLGSDVAMESVIYVQMRLARDGAAGDATATQLLINPQGARIEDVSGDGIQARAAGRAYVVTAPGLAAGDERQISVALRINDLRGRARRSGNAPLTKLEVALARQDGDAVVQDATAIGWPVIDGSAAFYQALQDVRQDRGEELKNGLREAQTPVAGLTGRRLFPVEPGTSGAAPKRFRTETRKVTRRVCVRRSRRRVRLRSGRVVRRRVCVRRATRTTTKKVRIPIKTAAPQKPTGQRKAERELLRLGKLYADARGTGVAVMRRRGQHGWLTQQLYTNLRLYLTQDQHPAICTGADTYADYLEGNARRLRETLQTAGNAADSALPVIDEHIASMPLLLLTEQGGHPGFGGASLGALLPRTPERLASDRIASAQGTAPAATANGQPVLVAAAIEPLSARRAGLDQGLHAQALIERVAAIVGVFASRESVAYVQAAQTPINALRRAKELFSRASNGEPLSKHTRSVATGALALVEAAHYVDLVNARYARVNSAIFGSLSDIRSAHERYCSAFR